MHAMEWLFQHEDDPDVDTPLPGEEEEKPTPPPQDEQVRELPFDFYEWGVREFFHGCVT